MASYELDDSALERSRRVEVQDAIGDAERWSGKEMAAQNVKHLEIIEIFIKNQVSARNNF
jgi:hypothetical protein